MTNGTSVAVHADADLALAASRERENEKQRRFFELDALRGFAAMSVVVYHFTNRAANNGDPLFDFHIGAHGVQLFFVISGFVIYWTLDRSKTLMDFAVSRLSRLYPAYWAAIAILVILELMLKGDDGPIWWRGYIANATMLQTFVGVKDVDIVYWTLAVELMFYVWMAAFFALGWLKFIERIAVGWLLLAITLSVMVKAHPIGWPWSALLIWQHIPYFAAGMMFYGIRREGWNMQRAAVLALAAIAVVVGSGPTGSLVAGVVFGIFALAVRGWLRWIVNPATVWLGAISYSLYLTHRAIGATLGGALSGTMNGWLVFALSLAMAIAVASLITLTIERPALTAIRSWYRSNQKRAND